MILKELCPQKNCGRPLKGEARIGSNIVKVYECQHISVVPYVEITETFKAAAATKAEDVKVTVSDKEITTSEDEKITKADLDQSFYSLDGSHKAYDFQVEGVYFAEKADLNCLIADEMGLGKTIQALIVAKRHNLKTLICVKGSITFQWAAQIKTWWNNHPLGVMPIVNRECIIPGFGVYIISIDFLSRKGVLEKLNELGIELLIVDECQNFKDPSSKRTRALITFIQTNAIKHKLFLSGTPVKNRANEYFVILNLLAPDVFHSYAAFCQTWLIPNEKGIYSRLDPFMIKRFHEVTSKWIIRREVKDVQKNLPKLTRDYQLIEIDDPRVKNAYNRELDLFSNFMRSGGRINATEILGWLAKFRAITGQAKIPYAIEYAEDFLDQTEHSLILGIHHHAVRDTLWLGLGQKGYNPLKFSGEDDLYAKERAKQAFIRGDNRLMIMNIVAGGTGTDGLQHVCHNAVVVERQWSSADEEQFEKRLNRDGQKYPVSIVYPIAKGTIDEWFDTLVGRAGPPMTGKRKIVAETMGDSGYDLSADDEMLKELTEMTLSHRL